MLILPSPDIVGYVHTRRSLFLRNPMSRGISTVESSNTTVRTYFHGVPSGEPTARMGIRRRGVDLGL